MSIIASVKPYIKYSMDMKAALPTVAYYCKVFAVTRGLDAIKNDTSGTDHTKAKEFLTAELNEASQLKKSLPEGTTKEDHRYEVENFVTSVFTNTEKEERTCETVTKKHA